MKEEWRTICEGFYEVSNMARVRRAKDGENTFQGRIKKPSLSINGYMIFGAFMKGKRKNILLHRAVAEAFIGPCPPSHQVNHIDGVKTNNLPSNLEYVTISENQKHANYLGLAYPPTKRARGLSHWTAKHPERVARGDDNGARKHPEKILRGDLCPASKLCETDIVKIRELHKNGEKHCDIARTFSITQTNVRHIVRRVSWKHVL